MVKCCVAAGHFNTYSENVSLFKFPRDPILRQQWANKYGERELNGVVPASTAFCVASTSLTAVFNRIRPDYRNVSRTLSLLCLIDLLHNYLQAVLPAHVRGDRAPCLLQITMPQVSRRRGGEPMRSDKDQE